MQFTTKGDGSVTDVIHCSDEADYEPAEYPDPCEYDDGDRAYDCLKDEGEL